VPEDGIDTSEIPEQLDLSHAVRGRAGLQFVMDLTRLRQALRTIRDWPADSKDRFQAARAMRQVAERVSASRCGLREMGG
jgi:hypothetical protein